MAPDNLFDHIKDDTLWKAAGAVFMGLWLALLASLKMIYNKDRRGDKAAIDNLYQWKDEVVDPHIKIVPVEYVRAPYCNRKHDEILASYDKRNTEVLAEMRQIRDVELKDIRDILVKHLVNGNAK